MQRHSFPPAALLAVAAIAAPLVPAPAAAREDGNALRLMGAVAFGAVEDAGYGATGIFSIGSDLGEVLGIELQGGVGMTEEAGIGTERFFHLELLVPATMTICSSDSWACPGSTFEFVVQSGIGGARFEGRWSPMVVAGVSLDSFKDLGSYEVGVRAGLLGAYDVIEPRKLTVMLHIHLGVVIRFGLPR
jgi:hypothetical protein